MTSGDLNIDLSESSFEMIFEDLSKAYFRFVLRLGTELDGGRLDAPPPRPTTEVSEHRPDAG